VAKGRLIQSVVKVKSKYVSPVAGKFFDSLKLKQESAESTEAK
jgi:hypothetical protein